MFSEIIKTTLKYSSIGISLLVATAGVLLYTNQQKMIYPSMLPEGSRDHVDTPDVYGIQNWKEISINSLDGTKLQAYHIKTSESAKTLLFCHANAGNMGHRLPMVQQMVKQFGWNVLIFSYRGYGKSEGSPSEAGIKMDADAAMQYLQDQGIKDIIVFGQSIGGAVAIYLASKYKIDALILENTFTNLPDVIPRVMPFLKYLTWLCSEKWYSDQLMPSIKVPLLFLSSVNDEMIAPQMQSQLFNMSPSTKKEMVFIQAGHNDAPMRMEYWQGIVKFHQAHKL